MKLFDAHAHLQDPRLTAHLPQAMADAQAASIERFACCGTSESDWKDVANQASHYPGIIPSFGLHPWYTRTRSADWLARLTTLLEATPAAGVGEIGLDHAIEDLDIEDQNAVFASQWALATRLNRPASIHCRRAWDVLLRFLQITPAPPRGFLIHSFSGSVDMISALAAKGAFFSFSGAITLSNNRRGHAAAAAVPPDRLLIETDAPDIPPYIPGTGRPTLTEPGHLIHVLQAVATLRNLSASDLADLTWRNACRFFLNT
jgi:TatD DNase family protein